jgi:tetratricopeptide (TPR) repeat protein
LKNKKFFYACSMLLYLLCAMQIEARENSSALYQEAARRAYAGNIDDAIVLFKKSITLSPYYSLAHYGLGKAYLYKNGFIKDAITELDLAITLDRSMTKAYFYLGMAYMLNKNYRRAIHSFDRAFELDTSYREALYNISIIYDLMGDQYKSEYYYRKYYEEKEKDTIFLDG